MVTIKQITKEELFLTAEEARILAKDLLRCADEVEDHCERFYIALLEREHNNKTSLSYKPGLYKIVVLRDNRKKGGA